MALQKKYSRKTMSFLTPQTRKTQSPPSRLSVSTKPENLLENLLNDPIKRVLLMEVLSQDPRKNNSDDDKKKLKKTPQKRFKFESPSALCRRRALEKMRVDSDSSDSTENKPSNVSAKTVPFDKILKGVVGYVEIMSNDKDRSAGAKSLMRAMGADVRDTLSRDVTHVVFKDGSFKTYQKARLLKVHLVSVLWIEAVRKNMYRVSEKNYPALGASIGDVNVSQICQQFQDDYADVIEDELNKTKKLNVTSKSTSVPHRYSFDVVNASQDFDGRSIISIRNNLRSKQTTPKSLYLDSTPELTSDSEPEFVSRTKTPKKSPRKSLNNATKSINADIASLSAAAIDKNSNIKMDRSNQGGDSSTQSVDIPPLRISSDSTEMNAIKTPSQQRVLNYNNVTERKKRPPRKNINILDDTVLVSPEKPADRNSDSVKKFPDVLIQKIYSEDALNVSPTKKPARKLYNVEDHIVLDEDSDDGLKRVAVNRGDDGKDVDEPSSSSSSIKAIPRQKPKRLLSSSSISSAKEVTSDSDTNQSTKTQTGAIKPKKIDDVGRQIDSGEEFELKKVLTPSKSPTIKTKSPGNSTANNAATPSKKFKHIVAKPVVDSSDEFVKPKPLRTDKKNPEITPRTPTRRSTRLLSAKETQNEDLTSSAKRRSTLDFQPKTPVSHSKSSQRNKKLKINSIVCTRFHNTEVQVFQQIVKKLGVFFVEDEVSDKTTHLVAAESRRTVNILRAIARGCWVLRSEWLYRSLEEGHWLPEEDYELTEFSSAVQKARLERQAFGTYFSMDVFENCGNIYVSRGTNPRCSDLQELVTLCKGSVTNILRNADIVVGEYVPDKTCVTVNWILDSVTFYKRKSLRNYMLEAPTSD